MPDEIILLVEDNDVLRDGLCDLIEGEGFQVVSAGHGLDALEKMETVTPDLIISDISMPEMDGFEFYHAVRADPAGMAIPFIFLTARQEQETILASKALGVEDYLVKPIDFKALISTIRARLMRNQQLMLAQLAQAYTDTLILLANAIELRDPYTRGHVERVTEYCLLIARQMHCTPAEINQLQFGAILHDIGKIYIQGNILSKAGPLDEDEWEEMRFHTVFGADLIQNIPFLAQTIPIIRYHHERWDGKGYPDGIAGTDIPFVARIVAAADGFDAMTSGRIYQDAISHQEALKKLQEDSGSRYDPAVISALDTAWKERESQNLFQ